MIWTEVDIETQKITRTVEQREGMPKQRPGRLLFEGHYPDSGWRFEGGEFHIIEQLDETELTG